MDIITHHQTRDFVNPISTDQQAEQFNLILNEQRGAHARVVLELTRLVDQQQRELNEIKIERSYVKVALMLLTLRLKRNPFLHRVFSHGLKTKVVRLLSRFGI